MFGDVEKATGLLSSVGIVPPPPPLAGRRWWVGFARDRRRMGMAAESFLPSERFHHRGRNNGHPDPSKRDSGGKYVLVRAPSQRWKASTAGGGGGGGGREAERALRVLLTQMISRLDIQRGIL